MSWTIFRALILPSALVWPIKYNLEEQFRSTSSRTSHGVFTLISSIISSGLKGTIFYSNVTLYTSIDMKRKYLESLRMNITNSYCKRRKHHLHLWLFYLIASFTRLCVLHLNVHRKIDIQMFVSNSFVAPVFIFFNISSKKFEVKAMHSITMHQEIIYSWILPSGQVAYQGREKPETGRGATYEQSLSDKPPFIRSKENYRTWQY